MARFGRRSPLMPVDRRVKGTVKTDRDVSALVRKLRPGDIAVVDLMDIDSRAAEALARRRPAAVVNAQQSISGRYPTGGPLLLVDAGILVIDCAGPGVLTWKDGREVEVDGGRMTPLAGDSVEGTVLTREAIDRAMSEAAEGMKVHLASFTANAMDVLAREADVLLNGEGLPDVGVSLEGKHVVVVTTGYQHAEQWEAIKRYVRERRPVVIAVGEAADAVTSRTRHPAVIVGNADAVSERALRAAQHVVIHDPRGKETGKTRVESLGVDHSVVDADFDSADVAVLLAVSRGARVIVTVGMDTRLIDFLEQDRAKAAGTFVTRLQAGPTVIAASTLAHVYRHRYSWVGLTLLVMSGVAALAVAIAASPGGVAWLRGVVDVVVTWMGGGS